MKWASALGNALLLLVACSSSGTATHATSPDASTTGGTHAGKNGGGQALGGASGGGSPSGGSNGNGAGGQNFAGAGGQSAGGTSAGGANGGTGGVRVGDAGPKAPLAGPLRVSKNGRYFTDANGRAIVLAGSHTWNDFQDWGSDGTPQPFDFTAYTQFLSEHGHNFTLLWRTELPKFCGLPTTDSAPPDFTVSPEPWRRTGPGNADDGNAKFDLTQFDAAYFDRLRSRVGELGAAGIWVGVYLFTGEWLNSFRCSGDGYPLSGSNNVNSIDDGGGNGSMTMTSPNALTDVQDAMVDKTIDTLNDLPNVLWIVSEEAAASTAWWQGHMIAHVHAYEAQKPFQHPVGLAAITGDSDQTIYDSDADWVAPFAKLSPTDSCGSGTPKCKVNVNDSDHSYFGLWNDSVQTNRQFVWENFLRGNQVAFMDPYTVYYPRQGRNSCVSPKNGICSAPDSRYENLRNNFGYVVKYSEKLDLNVAEPSQTLCSTTYCLGQTPAVGSELLVYAPDGGSFTVDLGHSPGRTMNYEWFDPASGNVVSTGTVPSGNAAQSFTTPSGISADSVLYLVDSEGHG